MSCRLPPLLAGLPLRRSGARPRPRLASPQGHVRRTGDSDVRGKVLLIVNVASACGYTDANYKGLQALHERFEPSGLEILAFPNNQARRVPVGRCCAELMRGVQAVRRPRHAVHRRQRKPARPPLPALACSLGSRSRARPRRFRRLRETNTRPASRSCRRATSTARTR